MNLVLFCSWQWRISRSLRRSTASPRMKRKISWRHMLVRLSFYTFAVKINSCFLNYILTLRGNVRYVARQIQYLHLASYLRISYLCTYDLYGPLRNGSGSTWIRIGLALDLDLDPHWDNNLDLDPHWNQCGSSTLIQSSTPIFYYVPVIPEMEATDIILAKIYRFCQLSR